jgi:hypothetical protein
VDHDRGPPILGTSGTSGRAERHERVGAPRVSRPIVHLVGHHRDLPSDPLDRPGDDRSLRSRELSFQPEAPALVEPPPGERPRLLRVDDLRAGPASPEIASMPDRCAGDPTRPADQIRLRLGRREEGELDHLVEAKLAALQRPGKPREGLQRVGSSDPAARLPLRDAVAHRQPVRQIAGTRISPDVAPVGFRDQREEPPLGDADVTVRVERGDEVLLRVCDPALRCADHAVLEHVFDGTHPRRHRL